MDLQFAHKVLCDAYSAQPYPPPAKDLVLDLARAQYDAVVAILYAQHGDTVHCNLVDCDLWSTFSDIYKSENGRRPREFWSRSQVLAYLNRSTETN